MPNLIILLNIDRVFKIFKLYSTYRSLRFLTCRIFDATFGRETNKSEITAFVWGPVVK